MTTEADRVQSCLKTSLVSQYLHLIESNKFCVKVYVHMFQILRRPRLKCNITFLFALILWINLIAFRIKIAEVVPAYVYASSKLRLNYF
jgi:hypothetical protein